MATRATYSINGICFYIHWDGYPSGAAAYLWKMHGASASSKGALAEAFLRGNESAEFTAHHDSHGDTEYRYTIEGDTLTAEKRVSGWDSAAPSFDPFFIGNWWEFINANSDMIDNFEPLEPQSSRHYFCNVTGRRLSVIRSGSQLIEAVKVASEELTSYAARFPNYTGNIKGLESRLSDAITALATYSQKHPRTPAKVAA